MASRDLDRTLSRHQDLNGLSSSTLPLASDDAELPLPAAIEEQHTHHRKTAANFKRLVSPSNTDYRRIHIGEEAPSVQNAPITSKLRQAISLREKWLYHLRVPEWLNPAEPRHSDYTVFVPPPYDPFDPVLPPPSRYVYKWHQGVVQVYSNSESLTSSPLVFPTLPFQDFADDLHQLLDIMNDPESRSFCYCRLMILTERFNLYIILNAPQERTAQIAVPHRDFYNVRKVDTHVHHSSLANQKHFLTFIKKKVRQCGDEKVLVNREDPSKPALTLAQVFQSLDLNPHELSVDTLDVHADESIFHRFDRFNLKYNPFGQSRLREIFMKTDNFLKGKYLAELTHQVFSELRDTKYQNCEYRISIYGRDAQEWDMLGAWFEDHCVYSDNVRWLIQIPRLYSTYKELKHVNSFQDMLDNIFNPMFEATIDPSSHPQVWRLLQQVVGFDSVDDESRPQVRTNLKKCGMPSCWDGKENPPYSYYAFYIYSNLRVLNQLREARGMNTLTYRPHAGEAGDVEHLAAGFLLAHGINHGLKLKQSPVLQYLFYLTQVGIAMSPLSNNALFCEYTKNPLPTFFKRGLNVTLSTDDPLQFALTREPLIEEYSVAGQVWKLSNTDLCELARNSVLQSGFEACVKAAWLGENWYKPGNAGNDISLSNVPSIRICYRFETLLEELRMVYEGNIPEDIRVLPTFVYGKEDGEDLTPTASMGPSNVKRSDSLSKEDWEKILDGDGIDMPANSLRSPI